MQATAPRPWSLLFASPSSPRGPRAASSTHTLPQKLVPGFHPAARFQQHRPHAHLTRPVVRPCDPNLPPIIPSRPPPSSADPSFLLWAARDSTPFALDFPLHKTFHHIKIILPSPYPHHTLLLPRLSRPLPAYSSTILADRRNFNRNDRKSPRSNHWLGALSVTDYQAARNSVGSFA